MAIDKSPVLFLVTPEDAGYLPHLKPMFVGRPTYVIDQEPDTSAEIALYAKSKNIKNIISCSSIVLNKVVQSDTRQSLGNWNGSLYESAGITYLFLNPLKQIYSVPYGKFLLERFISKITNPSRWLRTTDFTWELAKPETIERWYQLFTNTLLIAADIETVSFEDENGEYRTAIRCIAYTGMWPDGKIHTIVIPICEADEGHQAYWITWMRKFNSLPIPKIFQNGLYDLAHCVTYGAPVSDYFFDTQSLFHSWYSELPKRLDFISAFLVHSIFYWKDMAKTGGTNKLFEYNARDGWATMLSFVALLHELPDWAVKNYLIKFPKWVPCLAANLTGMRIDDNKRQELITHYVNEHKTLLTRVAKWFGGDFNPNSSPQVTALIQFYGSPDITNADEDAIRKFSIRHPLNARFARTIIDAKECVTILSKYLKPKDYNVSTSKSKRKTYLLQFGRLFYSHNPDGTDTGRFSCSEGYNWTGAQIQNVTQLVKEMYIADIDGEIYEIDNERSESYCTGFLSGDANLLETLRQDREEGKDFHIINATRFFGLKYEEVSPELRNEVSKRVNHGATYNMGAFVLLTTMGELAVDKAKILLGLPKFWNRIRVCEHLISTYDKAYPTIKKNWYVYIKNVVKHTHMMVSARGWTRWCFSNPETNKHALNSYIAHGPQNLSVAATNDNMEEIYWEVQHKNPKNFKLHFQVHDSIGFWARYGYEHLAERVREICENYKIEVTDIHGVKRMMSIPVAMKKGLNWKNMKKVSKP